MGSSFWDLNTHTHRHTHTPSTYSIPLSLNSFSYLSFHFPPFPNPMLPLSFKPCLPPTCTSQMLGGNSLPSILTLSDLLLLLSSPSNPFLPPFSPPHLICTPFNSFLSKPAKLNLEGQKKLNTHIPFQLPILTTSCTYFHPPSSPVSSFLKYFPMLNKMPHSHLICISQCFYITDQAVYTYST